MPETTQLQARLDELATDIGRLRRRALPGSSDQHLVDRLTAHVQALHALLEPTAAQLAAETFPGDEETIQLAIQEVDARARWLRERLGA